MQEVFTERSQNEEPVRLCQMPLYSVRDGHLHVNGWGKPRGSSFQYSRVVPGGPTQSSSSSSHLFRSIEGLSTVLALGNSS